MLPLRQKPFFRRTIVRNAQGGVQRTMQRTKSSRKRPFGGGICTSIIGKTVLDARRQIQQAEQAKTDLIEFRLDYIEDFEPDRDLEGLLTSAHIPYIVTYRPSWEGGFYEGDEEKRLTVLKQATELGAPFVDVELKAADAFFKGTGRKNETEIILSYHNYEHTPDMETLRTIIQQLRDSGADIAKISTAVLDIAESRRLMDLLQEQEDPTILIGMGDRGMLTRILAPKFGGFLTFVALSPEFQSASGQSTVHDMRDIYRVYDIRPETKVYGIVGNPVAHSKSPVFHNASFKEAGVDAVLVPLLVDDFPSFLKAFDDPDFAGFSVTIPHKEAALEAAEEVDELCQAIGACNTLIRTPSGSFRGYNTDCLAAIEIIETGLGTSLKDKTMVVVGAGGVSKALAYGGANKGAKVIIANRTFQKAQDLADRIPGTSAVSLESVQKGEIQADVLANGTSLGMEPDIDSTPVPKSVLHNFGLVFDAVYTPKETKLLKEAAEVGCCTASGVGMFVNQAKKQFELFTGKTSSEVVDRLFET